MKDSARWVVVAVVLAVIVVGGAVLAMNLMNDSQKNDSTPTNELRNSDPDSTMDEDKTDNKDETSKSHDEHGDDSTHKISQDEAGKIATDKYGGTVKEVESDHYHDKEAWEVEIRDSKQGRIEVKVDMHTGEILDMEKD